MLAEEMFRKANESNGVCSAEEFASKYYDDILKEVDRYACMGDYERKFDFLVHTVEEAKALMEVYKNWLGRNGFSVEGFVKPCEDSPLIGLQIVVSWKLGVTIE